MVMQRGKVLTKHSLLRGTLVPQNIPCQGNPQNFKPAITYGGSADCKKKAGMDDSCLLETYSLFRLISTCPNIEPSSFFRSLSL